MKRILITGATGNVGIEVIRHLFKVGTENKVIAGVRDIEKAKTMFAQYPQLLYAEFDFERPETYDSSLKGIDTVFMLRPPYISDVDKIFKPLIAKIREKGIRQIVFLSVQGVEKSTVIPHNKIEKLIRESNIGYVFLRPSYFMQNLTTTLLNDIVKKREIILPAGKAKFNWIDIKNIGEIAGIVLENFETYACKSIVLTGTENLNFNNVASIITDCISGKVMYRNVNPFRFYIIKKRTGMPTGMILVMIMLHFLPRFQKAPEITNSYTQLTGIKPTTLKEFIEREKAKFMIPQ